MGTLASHLLLMLIGLAGAAPEEERRQERGMWENLYKSSRRLDTTDQLGSRQADQQQPPYTLTDFGGFWSQMGSQKNRSPSAIGGSRTSGSSRAFSDNINNNNNNNNRPVGVDRLGGGVMSSERAAMMRPTSHQNSATKTTRTSGQPSGGKTSRETTAGFLERLKEEGHY